MKHNTVLTVTSLLSVLLLSLHVTDDVVRGFDPWGPSKLSFVVILAVWVYATLFLTDRRWGLALIILGNLLSALMPVIHLRIGPKFMKTPGAFFFIWTIFALGATGWLSVILAARALRRA